MIFSDVGALRAPNLTLLRQRVDMLIALGDIASPPCVGRFPDHAIYGMRMDRDPSGHCWHVWGHCTRCHQEIESRWTPEALAGAGVL